MSGSSRDESGETVTEAAIERILKAVGRNLVPDGLDRALLQRDLEYERLWHQDAVVLYDKTLSRKRDARLTQIRKAAKTIAAIDDDCWNLLEGARFCYAPSDPYREEPRVTARRLIEDVERTLRPPFRPEDIAPDVDGLAFPGSPFVRLAGSRLVQVFKRHFPGVSVGYTKTDGVVDQPYIRFAERSLIELGIDKGDSPYMRGSIANALTDQNKGRLRKRKFKHNYPQRRSRA